MSVDQVVEAKNVRNGIFFMLGATLVFASQDAVTKYLAGDFGTAQIQFVRHVMMLFYIFVVAFVIGQAKTMMKSSNIKLQIFRCVIIVVEMAVFVEAVRLLPLADTHAIMAFAPLMVVILSIPILGEKVGIRRISAVLFGMVGVMVVLRPGFVEIGEGNLWALLAANLFALYMVITRKMMASDSVMTNLFYMALICVILTAPFAYSDWRPMTWTHIKFLAVLGALGGLGHFFLAKAMGSAPAAILQPFNYMLLVWATIVGFVVFGNFPDGWTVVGASMIVSAGIYSFYREALLKSRRK